MIDIKRILFEICEDEAVFDENVDLLENGFLDSLALIELFEKLEDYGVFIQPTRIDRKKLRTVSGIEELVNEYINNTGINK